MGDGWPFYPVSDVLMVPRVKDRDRNRARFSVEEEFVHDVGILVPRHDLHRHAGRFRDAREDGDATEDIGTPRFRNGEDLCRTCRQCRDLAEKRDVIVGEPCDVVIVLELIPVDRDRREVVRVGQCAVEPLGGHNGCRLCHSCPPSDNYIHLSHFLSRWRMLRRLRAGTCW